MDEALEHARLAVRYAGDAGHVRLRAMALLMVARVATSDEVANGARERAHAIGRALEDDVLLARCDASRRTRAARSSAP